MDSLASQVSTVFSVNFDRHELFTEIYKIASKADIELAHYRKWAEKIKEGMFDSRKNYIRFDIGYKEGEDEKH